MEKSKRNEMWQENPMAVNVLDTVLMELIIKPYLNYIDPNLSREAVLQLLWKAIEDKKLMIYYDEMEGYFFYETAENVDIIHILGGQNESYSF